LRARWMGRAEVARAWHGAKGVKESVATQPRSGCAGGDYWELGEEVPLRGDRYVGLRYERVQMALIGRGLPGWTTGEVW
jgi:hypothetical protein